MSVGPQNIQPALEAPQPTLHEMILADAMQERSVGRVPGNFNAQMMDKLFACGLPTEHSDFAEYEQMILCCINLLPRIPNYNLATFDNIIRNFEDLVDEAHSEGLERQTASDMTKMILYLRALVPRGDFPLQGLTGVSALITTNTKHDTTVKMPQQPEKQGGIFGFLKR